MIAAVATGAVIGFTAAAVLLAAAVVAGAVTTYQHRKTMR